MSVDIHPLTADDLPELSRFLTTGFQVPAGSPFASPAILRWKFLRGDGKGGVPLSLVARDDSGAIVGHLGTCRTRFVGRGIESPIETLHMIDWLGSPAHRFVGAGLMRRAHATTPMQFGLGGSRAGRAVGERGGYLLVGRIPVYQKVLRPDYWLRVDGLSARQRWPRLFRDALRRSLGSFGRGRSAPRFQLRAVGSFGGEVHEIADQFQRFAVLTERTPSRLNALLDLPDAAATGWRLVAPDGRTRGLAVLNIIPRDGGATRIGKVVDCLLDTAEVDAWRGAVRALTAELARQGADVAELYAGTPWLAEALESAGYSTRFALEFRLRDRDGLIPREGPFHLTAIEADYAYT